MPTTGRRVSRRETVVLRRFHPAPRRNRSSRHNQEPCRTPTNRAVLLSSTSHRTAPCSSVLLQPLLHTAEPVRAGVVSEWVVGPRGAEPVEGGRSQIVRPSHRSAFWHFAGQKSIAAREQWPSPAAVLERQGPAVTDFGRAAPDTTRRGRRCFRQKRFSR